MKTILTRSPLANAHGGHMHVLRCLVEDFWAVFLLYNVEYDNDTVFHTAAHSGHMDVIRFFVEEFNLGYMAERINADDMSVLHVAQRRTGTWTRSGISLRRQGP
eukprot:Rmarinus@m.7846